MSVELVRAPPPPLVTELVVPVTRNPACVFLASRGPGSVASTRSSLRTLAKLLRPDATVDWSEVPWHAMTPAHAAALRGAILAHYPEPATATRLLNVLRGVLRTSWEQQWIDAETLARMIAALKNPAGSREPAGKRLTLEEVRQLFSAARPGELGVRDRAMLALLFAGGLRRAEVAGACTDGIDAAARTVQIIGKGNRQRTVPLGAAFAHVQAWMRVRGPEPGALLTRFSPQRELLRPLARITANAIYKALRDLAKPWGIEVSPHDARRTRLTELLESGLDLAQVQRFGGHASPLTTTRYDRRALALLVKAVNNAQSAVPATSESKSDT